MIRLHESGLDVILRFYNSMTDPSFGRDMFLMGYEKDERSPRRIPLSFTSFMLSPILRQLHLFPSQQSVYLGHEQALTKQVKERTRWQRNITPSSIKMRSPFRRMRYRDHAFGPQLDSASTSTPRHHPWNSVPLTLVPLM